MTDVKWLWRWQIGCIWETQFEQSKHFNIFYYLSTFGLYDNNKCLTGDESLLRSLDAKWLYDKSCLSISVRDSKY